VVQGGQRPQRDPAEAPDLSGSLPAPPGQLCGIDHVQLAIPDGNDAEQAAEDFYVGVLGLTRVPKPPASAARGGCWFEGPHVRLHLGVEEPFVPARKAHPGLVVDSLDAFAKRLATAGVAFQPADDVEDRRRGHCHDPFGNRLELVEIDGPTPEMFRTMADECLFPITLLDDEGVVRWVGWSVEHMMGWRPADVVGQSFVTMIAPHSLEAAVDAFAHVDQAYDTRPWGGVGVPIDIQHADGTVTPCEVTAVTKRHSGLPWYLVFTRKAGYERALDQAVEAMAAGASLGDVLTIVVDAVEQIVPDATVVVGDRWSDDTASFDVIAGRAASLLQPHPGAPWAQAVRTGHEQHVDCADMPASLAALARAEGYGACWVMPVGVGPGNQPEAAVVAWRPQPGPPHRFSHLTRGAQLLRLVLQWDRSQRTLEFAATHDPLTGLANRQALRDRLASLTRGRGGTGGRARHDDPGRAALLYLDLDRFKPVNDELGHAAGDRVLVTVAERLVAALRPGDLVARMGGDEFAVLCERLSSPDAVEQVAERLQEAVRQPLAHPGGTILLDVSIGIADLVPGVTVDTLLAQADDAMRSSKQSGRARWTRHGSPRR
jgi:diguanylate cyclase (GGDEF)-like protein/PAS domain S-box-containing protein